LGLTAAATLAGLCRALAENSAISMRRAAERTNFSNDEIKDGFFKTAFRAELQFDRHHERIRKFDEPIRMFVVNHGAPARTVVIAAIVKDIRARVNHLDLAMTSDRKDANVVVMLVPERDFAPTIRSRYGPSTAKTIQNSLHPQCLSGIAKDESYRIGRAEVILPIDADEFQFYDCAYEELLQSLGLQSLFVSVDPKRDTPEILSEYDKSLDPRMIGLTGVPAQIAVAAKSFNVFYERRDTDDGGYVYDHTTLIYLVDSDGRFVRALAGNADCQQIAVALAAAMTAKR
jgi:hypothetical protein